MPGNKEHPLVSVLLAFYNNIQYVEESIRSVINQTYKNIELIVVDDCSPDEKASQYIKELADRYQFTLIRKEKNQGASKAFQTAFEYSKGEWISIISQDDYYCLNKIEYQLNKVREQKLDCLYCNGVVFENANPKKSKKFDSTEVLKAQEISQKAAADYIAVRQDVPCMLTQGAIYRRQIFSDLAWMREKFLLDDLPFTIQVWRNYKTAFDDTVLYNYRLHDTNEHKKFWKWFPARIQTITELMADEQKPDTIGVAFADAAHYSQTIGAHREAYLYAVAGLALCKTPEHISRCLTVINAMDNRKLKEFNCEFGAKMKRVFIRETLMYKFWRFALRRLISLCPLKNTRKKLRRKYGV